MKKLGKKLAIFGAAFTLGAVALVGCGQKEVGHVKIGVLVKNPTTEQNVHFKEVLDEIAADQDFDVEFVMSEAIESAEQERSCLETWATAGIKGVISCVDALAYDVKGALMKNLGMYFMNYNAPDDARIASYGGANNEYYLGGFGAQNTDVESCYTAMNQLLEGVTGEHEFVIGVAMKNTGIEMFINRFTGLKQAIDEWAAKPGNSIKGGAIKELPGFGEGLVTQIQNALASQPKFLFAEAGASFWSGPIQAAKAANPGYQPVFGYVDSLTTYTYMEQGVADMLLCTNDDRIALAFAYLYNFCVGDTKLAPNTTEHEGKLVENLQMDIYTKNDVQKAKDLCSKRLYTLDEVKSVIVRLNSKATLETYRDLLYLRNK